MNKSSIQNYCIGRVSSYEVNTHNRIDTKLKLTRILHPIDLEYKFGILLNLVRYKRSNDRYRWTWEEILGKKKIRDILFDKFNKEIYITPNSTYYSYDDNYWNTRILLENTDADKDFSTGRKIINFSYNNRDFRIYINQKKTLRDAIKEGVIKKL
jgi:hypothetical protein